MYIIYVSIVLFYDPYYNFENCKGLLYNNIYTVAQSSLAISLYCIAFEAFQKTIYTKIN